MFLGSRAYSAKMAMLVMPWVTLEPSPGVAQEWQAGSNLVDRWARP